MVMARWQAAADAWNNMLKDNIAAYENAKEVVVDPNKPGGTPTDKLVLNLAQFWVNTVDGLDNVTEAWLGGTSKKPSEIEVNNPPPAVPPIICLAAASADGQTSESFKTNIQVLAQLNFELRNTSNFTESVHGTANLNAYTKKLDVQVTGLGGLNPVPQGQKEHWAGSLELPDAGSGPSITLAMVILQRNG